MSEWVCSTKRDHRVILVDTTTTACVRVRTSKLTITADKKGIRSDIETNWARGERERWLRRRTKRKAPLVLLTYVKPSILNSPFLTLNQVTNSPSLPVTPVAIVHNSLKLRIASGFVQCGLVKKHSSITEKQTNGLDPYTSLCYVYWLNPL